LRIFQLSVPNIAAKRFYRVEGEAGKVNGLGAIRIIRKKSSKRKINLSNAALQGQLLRHFLFVVDES